MKITVIPEQVIVECMLDIKVPDQDLRVEITDASLKLAHSVRGNFSGYLKAGLYQVRIGSQLCLIDVNNGDVSVAMDDEGFTIKDALKSKGEITERRELFPPLIPLTADNEVVTEPNGIYDAYQLVWKIVLILPDGTESREYDASSGIRSMSPHKFKAEVKSQKIYEYSNKKRYEE